MSPPTQHFARILPAPIWVLAAMCVLPELVLLGADWGVWGSARWRPLAYQNGAFWAGLLHGWRPNYHGQPVLMFFTYGWLHAGPGHLIGNLGALIWLAPPMLNRFGTRGFVALWSTCLLGGAAGFGLLTSSTAPMVGASGALFGLAGAWLVDEIHRNRRMQQRLLKGGLGLTAILAINAGTWALLGGQLAWETHLGGLVAGLAFAAAWRDRNDKDVGSL